MSLAATLKMSIGWKLRQLMADRRVTNEEMADKITEITGRSRHWVTISRWRQADSMPKIDGQDLEAIIQVLNCTRDELLGE
jgi:DNA-binding Xre family transcriptional regulator